MKGSFGCRNCIIFEISVNVNHLPNQTKQILVKMGARLETLCRFSPIVPTENNLCDFLFVLVYAKPRKTTFVPSILLQFTPSHGGQPLCLPVCFSSRQATEDNLCAFQFASVYAKPRMTTFVPSYLLQFTPSLGRQSL